MSQINTNLAYNQILHAHDIQQQITSDNIANVNTPGYKAKAVDLKETFSQIFTNERKRIAMNTTSSSHISGGKFGAPNIHVSRVFGEEKPNGNNVDLSSETLRASKNEMDRSAALEEYRALNKLLALSIGSRG